MSKHERTARAIAHATARERLLISAIRGGAAGGSDQLCALLDLCRALESAGIAYALIGGIAVGIHSAVPRATQDVDVAVASTVPRGQISAALRAAGFSPRGSHPHSVNFWHSSGEPIQAAIDAEFDPMIERAESISIEGVAVRIVRRDDLIAMKERASKDPARRKSKSLRDQADIEVLRGDVPDPDEGW